MQEQGVSQWETEARVVKTSEDQYERADSNSSKSSTAEENLSPKSNTHNTPSMLQQQPAIKPDFNRVFFLHSINFKTHVHFLCFYLAYLSTNKSSIIN